MQIIVSVVICSFNRARLLNNCLNSLFEKKNTPYNFEVIVIDNNSTDDTEFIVQFFMGRHSNVKYFKEINQGLSHARNRGFMEAIGDYVAYIDDDALAEHGWIENIIDFISRLPSVVAFGGPYDMFTESELPAWLDRSCGSWSLGDRERPIDSQEWLNGTNMVFKKKLLQEVGGFNVNLGMKKYVTSYGEETNFLLKIRRKGLPIYYVPSVRVRHLFAEYKMSLAWLLGANYHNGFSALETFNLRKQPLRQACLTLFALVTGSLKFIFGRERFLKARVLGSYSHFFWTLGLAMRMLRR